VKTANRMLLATAATTALAIGLPAAALADSACTVTFRLRTHVTLASLQFDVGYDRADIEVPGSDTSVSCHNLAPALPSFTDDDAGAFGVLHAAYIAPGGFSGPRDLVVCDFTIDREPYLTDFQVTVFDAMDPAYQEVSPMPVVVPSKINCGGVYDTTTTTSTSTSTTTTTLPWSPMACSLEFSLTDAVTLGSLQWDVDYNGAPGEFAGSGSAVQCQNKVLTAFGSMQDREGDRTVTTALISLAGFSGPRLLTRCTFLADDYPLESDFTITVSDASSPTLVPILPLPGVVLSDITCTVDTTTTTTTSTTTTTLFLCGDGSVDDSEECDDGPLNGSPLLSECRVDCLLDRLCGDGDNNGVVNVIDAQWVLKASINLVGPCPLAACDTSNDAAVTVSDALRILYRSVGLVPELVCAQF
jgi:hypothetical protein